MDIFLKSSEEVQFHKFICIVSWDPEQQVMYHKQQKRFDMNIYLKTSILTESHFKSVFSGFHISY